MRLGSLDIYSQNEDNNSIVHMVCKMGKIEVLRKILKCSDVHHAHAFSIQNNDKDTPLHLAVANCKSTELVELVATPDNVNIMAIHPYISLVIITIQKDVTQMTGT